MHLPPHLNVSTPLIFLVFSALALLIRTFAFLLCALSFLLYTLAFLLCAALDNLLCTLAFGFELFLNLLQLGLNFKGYGEGI